MDYLTNIIALLGAFVATLTILLLMLPLLKKKKIGQEILCYVSEHNTKQGTPTMGGVAFIVGSIIVSLFFFKGNKTLAMMSVVTFFAYGMTGFLDDFLKIKGKHNLGLKAYQKIILQLGIALILACFCYENMLLDGKLYLPFSHTMIELDFWIIPLVVFVFLAMSNGVNLTDGLDGLAGGTSLSYLTGVAVLLSILSVDLLSSGKSLLFEEYVNMGVLCWCTIGGLLAFLLFNCFPAKIFMGDTGSLALGAICTCLMLFSRLTLLIPILGIMFVVSCVSVVLQVVFFKIKKKRIFLKAPFHHHLQLKGISETRIGVIYCTITVIVSLISIAFWV